MSLKLGNQYKIIFFTKLNIYFKKINKVIEVREKERFNIFLKFKKQN
jgi:hypothetical protein